MSSWKKNAAIEEYIDNIFHLLKKNFNRTVENFVEDRFPIIKNGLMAWRPHIDLRENEKDFVLKVDLPGVEKKDLVVEINDEVLTICGERVSEEQKDEDKQHWLERFHGKFCRSFSIPEDVIDYQKIDAKFDNGVLTLILKKKPVRHNRADNKSNARRIEIK